MARVSTPSAQLNCIHGCAHRGSAPGNRRHAPRQLYRPLVGSPPALVPRCGVAHRCARNEIDQTHESRPNTRKPKEIQVGAADDDQ